MSDHIRVLITHPHDGHAPNETCLDCQAAGRVMSRDEWIQAVGRQLARTMPDMYPEGYAYWLAEQYADEGGYDRFIAGEFSDDHLWESSDEPR